MTTRPPRRWLAALLSFLTPGVGQLYAGRPARAGAFFTGVLAIVIGWGHALVAIPSRATAPMVFVSLLALVSCAAVDAWRVAGRWLTGAIRPIWTRWYIVVPFWFAGGLALDFMNQRVKRSVVEAFRVATGALEPTLLIGDYIIVDKRAKARRTAVAAVVVYESIEEPGLKIVKRIVGLPGDTLAMQGGTLIRNGVPVDEPWVRTEPGGYGADPLHRVLMKRWQARYLVGPASEDYSPDLMDWGPLLVPPDSLFVLGDARGNSYDSRYFGFIPLSHIRGRPRYIYLSRDTTGAIRWGRHGMIIR